MIRRGAALVLVAFATAFVGSLVFLDYPEEGAIVASFSQSHGLHAGDLLLLGGWVLVMALAVVLYRGSGRHRD
ncbi:hypothetical protein [Geodermatophilus sp. SYSU D01036]